MLLGGADSRLMWLQSDWNKLDYSNSNKLQHWRALISLYLESCFCWPHASAVFSTRSAAFGLFLNSLYSESTFVTEWFGVDGIYTDWDYVSICTPRYILQLSPWQTKWATTNLVKAKSRKFFLEILVHQLVSLHLYWGRFGSPASGEKSTQKSNSIERYWRKHLKMYSKKCIYSKKLHFKSAIK